MGMLEKVKTSRAAQRLAWRLDAMRDRDKVALPPTPWEDPAYWQMIEPLNQAWGQTCTDAHDEPHLDFEQRFRDRVQQALDEAGLGEPAREAAAREAARRLDERRDVIARAQLVEHRLSWGDNLREIRLMSGRQQLGIVRYAVCPTAEHAWLGKISIGVDWHRGGLGRRVIQHLTERFPQAHWTTSAQMSPGFWAQMRQESDAGWSLGDGACSHGWEPMPSSPPRTT